MTTATQNENENNRQETGNKRKRSNLFPSNEQFEYLERRCNEAKSKLISAKAEIKELLYEVEIERRVAGRLGRDVPEEVALAVNAANAYSESESTNKSIESPSNRQETIRDHQTGMHRGVNPFPGASGPPMRIFGGPVPLGRHWHENPFPGRFEPPIRIFGGLVFPGRHWRSWREFNEGKKELKETQKKVDQAHELVARLKNAIGVTNQPHIEKAPVNGKGLLVHSNGHTVEGEWKEGELCGEAFYKTSDGKVWVMKPISLEVLD